MESFVRIRGFLNTKNTNLFFIVLVGWRTCLIFILTTFFFQFLDSVRQCAINSKLNGAPKGATCPFRSYTRFLAVAKLWTRKFATAKIECRYEMGKKTPLGVPFILQLMISKTFAIADQLQVYVSTITIAYDTKLHISDHPLFQHYLWADYCMQCRPHIGHPHLN